MLIQIVERAHCLTCDQDVAVARISATIVPRIGASMPEYICQSCGARGVVFIVGDEAGFYLGRGLSGEFAKIPGITPADSRRQAP